jgi:hypothetical protein
VVFSYLILFFGQVPSLSAVMDFAGCQLVTRVKVVLVWLAILGQLITTNLAKRLPPIYWNSSNPIFRIDNTDHVISVNIRDKIDILCPSHAVNGASAAELSKIYMVDRLSYSNCHLPPNKKMVGVCKKPFVPITVVFREFTPKPNGLEFRTGRSYYFISTSNGTHSGLHNTAGGLCLVNNMKLKFDVIGDNRDLVRPNSHSQSSVITGGSRQANSQQNNLQQPGTPRWRGSNANIGTDPSMIDRGSGSSHSGRDSGSLNLRPSIGGYIDNQDNDRLRNLNPRPGDSEERPPVLANRGDNSVIYRPINTNNSPDRTVSWGNAHFGDQTSDLQNLVPRRNENKGQGAKRAGSSHDHASYVITDTYYGDDSSHPSQQKRSTGSLLSPPRVAMLIAIFLLGRLRVTLTQESAV